MGKARIKLGMAVVARISVTGCIAAHEHGRFVIVVRETASGLLPNSAPHSVYDSSCDD